MKGLCKQLFILLKITLTVILLNNHETNTHIKGYFK